METLLEPWSEGDLELERRFNAPEMTVHLGGPEPDAAIVARHERFLALPGAGSGQMFRIMVNGVAAGGVGYWAREDGHEMGWSVLPEFQGRGVASAAVLAALAHAQAAGCAAVDAYPAVANEASNALCERTGFTLVEEMEFEYPKGHLLRCNHWRVEM